MKNRVYLLIDVLNSSAEYVAQVLRGSPGVIIVDTLEDPPDIVIVVEAPDREQLAKWAIEALSSVENITGQVQLLPTRNGSSRIVTRLGPSH